MWQILATIGLVLLVFLAWRRPWRKRRSGFMAWVKDPDYRRAVIATMEAEKQVSVPPDLSRREIDMLVERLLKVTSGDSQDFAHKRLQLLGPRAVPSLLVALDDPRYWRKKVPFHYMEPSPYEMVLDIIEPYAPVEAVPTLCQWAAHEDEWFRTRAIAALGNIGSSDCIRPVLSALKGKDDVGKSSAIRGIRKGIEAEHAEREFLDAFFDPLAELIAGALPAGPSCAGAGAPDCLMAIDPERAKDVLLSERVWKATNPMLVDVLGTLYKAKVTVPLQRIRSLTTSILELPAGSRSERLLGRCLTILAHAKDPDALPWVEKTLREGGDFVRQEAAEALCYLNGMEHPSTVVFAKESFEALTESQQNYYAALNLEGEVDNGGFHQYYVNTSGNYAHYALRALEAMECGETASLLKKTFALFGPEGPSIDREKRQTQLEALTDNQDKAMKAIDGEFYKNRDDRDVKRLLYAIQNKADFLRDGPET